MTKNFSGMRCVLDTQHLPERHAGDCWCFGKVYARVVMGRHSFCYCNWQCIFHEQGWTWASPERHVHWFGYAVQLCVVLKARLSQWSRKPFVIETCFLFPLQYYAHLKSEKPTREPCMSVKNHPICQNWWPDIRRCVVRYGDMGKVVTTHVFFYLFFSFLLWTSELTTKCMDFRYVHAETCFGGMWLVIVVWIVVTGSCRPVLRSVVRRHVYESGEFVVRHVLFTCISTTLVIFSYYAVSQKRPNFETV